MKSNKKCKTGMTTIKLKNKTMCIGKCPHSGGPIIYDPQKDELFCPWHGSRFNVKTGVPSKGPAKKKLKMEKL
jgi:nitrite reductase/ring-hydroxylating ferredoxin subunit